MQKCSGVVVSDLVLILRSERSKEEVLTERAQIFAVWMQEDDLQKLVKLLLVTSIVRERT